MDTESYVYHYDIEELDDILEKMQQGIEPAMMNAELKKDLQIRLKEHQDAMDETDEYDIVGEPTTNRLTAKIQADKRKASKTGGIIITVSEEQKKKVREEMSQSIVRTDHTSNYNQNDEDLYSSLEKREIFQRLNSLRNIYYKQADYQNAIKIIHDAIEYSIKNEFPMYSEQEVRKLFAEGKIKYQRPIPKLYMNYVKEITDRTILKGIVTGEINVVDTKTEEIKKKRSKKECICPDKIKTIHNCEKMKHKFALKEKLFSIKDKTSESYEQVKFQLEHVDCQKDKCVHYGIKTTKMDYVVIGPKENEALVQLHRQGHETIISPSIRMKSGIYDRYALPSTNMFGHNNVGKQTNPELQNFDWLQPDAGKKYYQLLHGKKYTTNDLIADLSKSNNEQLTPLFRSSMHDFLNRLKYSNSGVDMTNEYQIDKNYTSSSLQVNVEAAKMEEDILNAMRMHNINLNQ